MGSIDLAFKIGGTTIPVDHGYSLFSAICRVVPALHGDTRVGVHPIRGKSAANGLIALGATSRIRVRLPSDHVAVYLALGGIELDVDGHRVQVGIPKVEGIVPAANLASRLVTFKNALTPESFLAHVRGELDRMKLDTTAELVPATRNGFVGQPIRRVLRVKDKRVVGFSVRVLGLTAQESILLQEKGLGGRRRMGCGIFVPMP